MPAFDPVRDAVLNSPIDSPIFSPTAPRRATDLSMLLNQGPSQHQQQHQRPSTIHSLLQDGALDAVEPMRRAPMDIKHISPQNQKRAPTSASTTDSQPSRSTLPYNPKRITKPDSVLIPLTKEEVETYKNYRGEGASRLILKRKRGRSQEPDVQDTRPAKKHVGDVAAVVQHCLFRSFIVYMRGTDTLNIQTIPDRT